MHAKVLPGFTRISIKQKRAILSLLIAVFADSYFIYFIESPIIELLLL